MTSICNIVGIGVAALVLQQCNLSAAEKITYEDQVLPLLRNTCLKCHNPDKLKGDLDLSTFAGVLKGGGSGTAVVSGDADGSKLIKAITHAEEPNMPPNSPKLPDKDIDVFRKWIAGGLLETSGSKALAAAKSKVDLTIASVSAGRPEGPPPMPGDLLQEPFVRTGRPGVSTGLASSPWAPLVALGGQRQVLLYNSDTLDLIGVLPYPEGYPCDLKFSRSGKLLLAGGGHGSKSGQVVVWDVTTGERMMTIGDEFDSVLAADMTSDQKYVALGGPGRLVKIFSTKDGSLVRKMKKHTDWVTALEFSPDGKYLATGDRNGGLLVWESESGEEVYTLTGHKSAVTAVSWRDDSNILFSGSEDGSVRMWSMKDGEQAKTWNANAGGVLALRSAHDGRTVTCGRDNRLAIWDANGGKARSVTYTNELPVRVTLTHDGGRLVSSDFAGSVLVWNSADGKLVGELALNPAPLAERIQAAETKIAALAATNQNTVQVAAAKASLERMKLGQAYAVVYRAREELATHLREQEKALADADAARKAGAQAALDLTIARKASPKTKEEKAAVANKIKALSEVIKSSAAQVSAAQASLARLARSLPIERARVEKLTADYERLKSSPPAAASQSAKL